MEETVMKKILFSIVFTLLTVAMYTNIFASEKDYYEYYNSMELIQSEEGYGYSIKDDGTLLLREIIKDTNSKEKVIIPESLDGMPVTELGYSLLSNISTDTVVIPKTVSSIPCLSTSNNIGKIFVDEENPYFVSVDGVLLSRDMTKLVYYPSNKDEEKYCVPDGVKEICSYAFSNSILKELDLPKSLEIIGEKAFQYCDDLTELYIPENVKEIKEYALNDIKTDHYDLDPKNSNFKIVNRLLYSSDGNELISCPGNLNLINLEIPEGTEVIRGAAFASNRTLTTVKIPKSIKEIEHDAFHLCNSLIKVDFYEKSNLSIIGDDAFSFSGLKLCDLPDSVKVIGNSAFWKTNLSSLKLPNNLERLRNFSYSNIDINELFIPDTLVNIGEDAFTYLNIRSFRVGPDNEQYATIDGVLFDKKRKSMFHYPNLKNDSEYYIPNGIKEINRRGFFKANALNFVSIPDTVTTIGEFAFAEMVNLEQAQMPDSVTEMGDYAFQNCLSLRTINISSNLKSIGKYTFSNCSGMTEIIIPGTIEKIMDRSFANCINLKNLVIREGVKEIYSGAFFGCSSIVDITIPDSVEILGTNAFSNCSSLHIVDIGSGLKKMGNLDAYSNQTDDEVSVFTNCDELEAINVSVKNKNFKSIDGVLFVADGTILVKYPPEKYIEYYEIPDDVEIISSHAFQKSKYLERVDFPDGVTKIGDYAFEGCLISIGDLPEDLESIGTYAFANCQGIKDITIPDSVTYIGHKPFEGGEFVRIDVDSDNEKYFSQEGVLFDIEKQMLLAYPCRKETRDYVIPDGTKIIDNVFFNCDNLSRVSIPASVEEIVYSYVESPCFEDCDNLKTILVKKGSYAETWAIESGYNVEYLDEYDWLNE